MRASALIENAESVWDMTLPWVEMYWSVEVLKRYRRAGYTYISLTIQDMPASFSGVLTEVARFKELCAPHSDWLTFARTQNDIIEGQKSGKLVLGLNVQDTVLVHEDLERLRALKDLGVRHMLLAYQLRNRAADGCAEPDDAGLSLFGRRLVKKMNEVGMIIDCSHTGRRSSLEAIELSSDPVIFSHSGAKSVCEHIRNIDDDQIRACAGSGGAVGIVGIGAFIGDPQARAETVFRHIDHVVQLVGPTHVGIGTDFIDDMDPVWPSIIEAKDGMWRDPSGTQIYEGVSFAPEQLEDLVEIMLQQNYSDDVVKAILGGNFRRVYDAVGADPNASSAASNIARLA